MKNPVLVSNVAELAIAIDFEEPFLTVESMIHHYINGYISVTSVQVQI